MENYYDKLVQLYEETKVAFDKLNGLQSALDRKVSDIYHSIEKTEFDPSNGFIFAMQLKETLQQRRVVKDELHKLFPVYRMLRDNLETVEERYNKAVAKSIELKSSLNVTKNIDGVLAEIG